MKKINKVKLFVNKNEKCSLIVKKLEWELRKFGFKIVDKNYDLAISVGGDGSFLRMVVDSKFKESLYYIGVNVGTLGFLQEINMNDCHDFVKRLSTNDFKIEKIFIEETKIITEDKVYKFNSLNEIVFRDCSLDILKLAIYVDDELLENFVGDGIMISTATGSTAYNMSSGGPIIYNTLNTLVVTPICPINSKVYRNLTNSVVIPCKKIITIIPEKNHNNLFVTIDGVNQKIDNILKIETKIENKSIKCIRMNDYHFIKLIRDKILGQ